MIVNIVPDHPQTINRYIKDFAINKSNIKYKQNRL